MRRAVRPPDALLGSPAPSGSGPVDPLFPSRRACSSPTLRPHPYFPAGGRTPRPNRLTALSPDGGVVAPLAPPAPSPPHVDGTARKRLFPCGKPGVGTGESDAPPPFVGSTGKTPHTADAPRGEVAAGIASVDQTAKSIGIPNAAGKGAGPIGEVRESRPRAGILPRPGGAPESR